MREASWRSWIYIPHKLKEIHLTQQINVCCTHFKCNTINSFLKQIITGDEKWIKSKKIMVQAWWTSTNHIESWIISEEGHAINLVGLQRCFVFWAASKQPNNQLRCLLPTTYETKGNNQREKSKLANHKEVLFYHDNARPHVSFATCTILLELA